MSERINKSVSMGWLNLDAWSEMYVGAYWLVTNELPDHQHEAEPRHGPLSQMVLLGSHHLIEIMLFQCIRRLLERSPGTHHDLEQKYDGAQFRSTFLKWPEKLVGKPFDSQVEPFKSALALAKRRNATIHKESTLTTLCMARSALYTAVHASKAIEQHLLGSDKFKYEKALQKYPLSDDEWFSEVTLVDSTSRT